jgi:hypothetical protein
VSTIFGQKGKKVYRLDTLQKKFNSRGIFRKCEKSLIWWVAQVAQN